jgi:Cof subfamily protein (haloacid dehalogenase superfamily)
MIRLVAIDVDDTLITDELTIPQATSQAIAKALAKGVEVTLATGRMYRSALPYAVELNLTGPLIAYNGAMIKTVAGEELYHCPIPAETVRDLASFCQDQQLTLQVYIDDVLYVEEINEYVDYYMSIASVPAIPVGPLNDFIAKGSTKALVVGQPSLLDKVQPQLAEAFGGLIEVVRSKPAYIEMTRRGISKAHALEQLAQRYGLSRDQIMAIGDSFNDLEMIRYAGIGVAVANAAPQVKEAADYVTLSNEEAGVAEALIRFLGL